MAVDDRYALEVGETVRVVGEFRILARDHVLLHGARETSPTYKIAPHTWMAAERLEVVAVPAPADAEKAST